MRVKPDEEMQFELELRCLAYRHAQSDATRSAIDLADGISGLASVIASSLALELSSQMDGFRIKSDEEMQIELSLRAWAYSNSSDEVVRREIGRALDISGLAEVIGGPLSREVAARFALAVAS